MLSTQPRVYPPHPYFRPLSFTLASALIGCATRNRRT
jgi:hypothetical protein